MANSLVGTLRILLTANAAEYEAGLKKASDSTKKFGTDVGGASAGIASSLTKLVSIGALTAFGKQLLDAADATVKLSDKTGIAIEPLQRLQYIAGQSGNTIEQVSSAVSQMQKRLAGGDKSAIGALNQLGLSFEQLMALTPDQQFETIARSVGSIEDPMKRTQVAMALFGKSGAEILPTLIADFDELGNQAPVVSEKATKAFDAIGDGINRVWVTMQNLVGNGIGLMIDGYSRLGQAASALVQGDFGKIPMILADVADVTLPKVPPKMEALVRPVQNVTMSMDEMDAVAKDLNKSIEEQTKKTEAQAQELREFKKAQDALFGRDLIGRANDYAKQLGDVANVSKLTKEKKEELNKAVTQALEAYRALGEEAPRKLHDIWIATVDLTQETMSLSELIDAGVFGKISDDLGPAPTLMADTAIAARAMGIELKAATDESSEGIEEASRKTVDWDGQIKDLTGALADLAQISGDTFGSIVRQLSIVIGAMNAGRQASVMMAESIAQIRGGNAGEGLLGVATGALGAASALGQATSQGSTLSRTLGGVAAGARIGSAFGPWGTAIGAAAGAVIGLVRGLSGIPPEVKKAREELEKFQEGLRASLTDTQRAEAGTEGWRMDVIAVRDAYLAVGRTAAEAEDIVEAMWDTDHPERSKKAIEEINKVLQEQQAILTANKQELADLNAQMEALAKEAEIDWRKMEDAAKRYGIDLAGLGPAFQSARLHETAQEIWNDFVLLQRGGADVGTVLSGMQDEIQQLVLDSRAFGVAIPENFKPLIQNLIESGQLVDENGEKLTDLGSLNFGDPIVSRLDEIAESMKTIAERIAELVQKITGPLIGAINSVPTEVPINFVGTFTPPDIPNLDVPHMARGGVVTAPTLALIGERGPEAVVPLNAWAARSGAGLNEESLARRIGEQFDAAIRRHDMTLRVVMRDALVGRAV